MKLVRGLENLRGPSYAPPPPPQPSMHDYPPPPPPPSHHHPRHHHHLPQHHHLVVESPDSLTARPQSSHAKLPSARPRSEFRPSPAEALPPSHRLSMHMSQHSGAPMPAQMPFEMQGRSLYPVACRGSTIYVEPSPYYQMAGRRS